MFRWGKPGKNTIKKKKSFPTGSIRATLQNHCHMTLGSGDLTSAVALPNDTELNDWLAVHVIDFFNSINLIWGLVIDECNCKGMTAGKKYEYAWADGVTIKKPIKCSAKEYVRYLLDWADKQTKNPNIFPEDPRVPFPKNFKSIVSKIFKRVFAHVALHHIRSLVALGAAAHFNTALKHFYIFCNEFDLVPKSEYAPLQAYLDELTGSKVVKVTKVKGKKR